MDENIDNIEQVQQQVDVVEQVSEIIPRSTSALSRAQKLINSKSVQLTEQKHAAILSNQLNELDLTGILSKDDFAFYMQKKAEYTVAYPDLEMDPFDLDDLHLLIVEHIMLRNLLKRKKSKPSVDISKDYADCVKRINELKKSLSMRRTDRIKTKTEGKKQQINIASMSVVLADPKKAQELEEKLKRFRAEEESLASNSDKVGQ